MVLIGLLALAGALGKHGDPRAAQLPPQVIKSGFESTDSLLKDVERAETRNRILRVDRREQPIHERAHRAFMPDVGDPPSVDLPVNIGIIKGPDGEITLYDAGWKQLAYIFDWNTSCCWQDLRVQMAPHRARPRGRHAGSSSAMRTGITRAS